MSKIPLSVSSSLKNADDLIVQPIEATPYGNETGKTGTAAPVLIAVESAKTVDVETFAASLPMRGGQGTEAQARLIVNAFAAVLSDYVAEYGAFSVATPLGRIETMIAGSLANATDTPDPDVNVPFLALIPSAQVMKTFSQMEAYVPTGVCPVALKRVSDKATGEHVIKGASAFYLQGYGMTIGSTGESLELLNPLTRAKVCDITVDATSKSTVQFTCTLSCASAIAAGTYLIRLKTLSGGAPLGGTIWPVELKVTLATAYEPPAIDQSPDGSVKVMTFKDGDQSAVFTDGHTWTGGGQGFTETLIPGLWAFNSQKIRLTPDAETTINAVKTISADGKSFTIVRDVAATVPSGTYPNARVEIELVNGSESYTMKLPINYVVA